jgi:hypothetical protein
MDIPKRREVGPCPCGRGTVWASDIWSGPGVCEHCWADGVQAFWDLYDGKITLAGFMRRLRRVSRRIQ